MIRYRFVFAKKTPAKIGERRISDYLKTLFFENFPLCDSKKGRFSFGPSLPLGFESESEYVDVYMERRLDEKYIRDMIEKNISSDYSLLRFKTIPLHFPSVESVVDAIEYVFHLDKSFGDEFLFVNIKGLNCSDIFDLRVKNSVVGVILRKDIKVGDFINVFLRDFSIIRKIRKNLYWIDSNNRLRII
jgi:uncharacterized protein (DUF2344 family)